MVIPILYHNLSCIMLQMYDSFHAVERGQEGFMMFPVLLHPRTTGKVQLRDDDPFSQPKITMHYLENPADVNDLIEGESLSVKNCKGYGCQFFLTFLFVTSKSTVPEICYS